MHTEDSPLERTPDLVAKIRALREQAEKDMDRFTSPDDYDVRRVAGRKPKTEIPEPQSVTSTRKRTKKAEQASIPFASVPVETGADDGEES